MSAAVERLRAQHIRVRICAPFGLDKNMLRLAVRTDAENDELVNALEMDNLRRHDGGTSAGAKGA